MTGLFVNHEYGFALVRMGNLSTAAETFQKMISEDQDSKKARGYRSLGLLDMYEGKYSAAFANFKEAILLNKAIHSLESEYRDHMFLASAYRTKGRTADFASELAAANRILSRAHFGPIWSMHLAKTYARMGKTAEATKLLNDMMAQAQNPMAISGINNSTQTDQAATYVVKGEIALANMKVSEAMESFELAQRVRPGDLGLESLAFAYQSLGKPRDSALKYEEIVAAYSLGTEKQEYWILAHYELARLYRELGDTQKAKEYYEKLLNIWKDADPDIPILVAAKAEYGKLK
jgi:predicted Zn-dependent protease